jgi:PAT family beta-lactamase induction signal transducer AmpG
VSSEKPDRPTPDEGFARRIRWVALLYFAEGFPFGVYIDIWPVFFRAHGVSLRAVGLMRLLGIPYTVKPLWAPLVDRYGDRRRWIFGCLLAMAALLAIHPLFDPAHPGPRFWAVLLAFTLASATQDIAIDAHTIAFLHRGEEGAANGVRVSAARVAIIVAGGGLVALAGVAGWNLTFWLGAAILLALAPIVLRAPAAALDAAKRKEFFKPLRRWLTRPASLPTLLFILFYKVGDTTLGAMTKTFWVDRRLTLAEIGLISTTLGLVMTILGALLGGWLTTRWGIIRALFVLGIAQVAPNLLYAAVAAFEGPRGTIYAASMLESFGQGMGTAAFLALLMRLCDREHAATEYAVLSALFALSRDVFASTGGRLVEWLGYPAFFTLTFFLGLPALALLPWVRQRLVAIAET